MFLTGALSSLDATSLVAASSLVVGIVSSFTELGGGIWVTSERLAPVSTSVFGTSLTVVFYFISFLFIYLSIVSCLTR